MTGTSTRFAFKILSEKFNFDSDEVAADPVHLMYVLEQAIKRDQFPKEQEKKYLDFIKSELAPRYAEFIGNEVQKAYLESYHDYGQNLRSEEHTSELQSLMRISYAVFCLKKKKQTTK